MARELPIQNGRLTTDLDADGHRIVNLAGGTESVSWDDVTGKPTFATVATSGSYNDLTGKPTIPEAVTIDSALSPTSTNPVQNRVVKQALTLLRNVSAWVPEVTSSGEHIINGPLVFDTEGWHWSDSPIEIWDRNDDVVGPGRYRVNPYDDGYDDPDAMRIGLIEAEDESADPQVYLYLRRYEGYILGSQEDKPLAGIADLPDVAGKENASNKVTSLSAASTDAQYPSAKCVYDGLAGKADKAALSYALVDVNVTNGTATLTDRAINAVSLTSAATLTMPAAISGYARDLVARLVVGADGLNITWGTVDADGVAVDYETEDGEFPDLSEAGTYLVRLTETSAFAAGTGGAADVPAKFLIQCQELQTAAAGGGQ